MIFFHIPSSSSSSLYFHTFSINQISITTFYSSSFIDFVSIIFNLFNNFFPRLHDCHFVITTQLTILFIIVTFSVNLFVSLSLFPKSGLYWLSVAYYINQIGFLLLLDLICYNTWVEITIDQSWSVTVVDTINTKLTDLNLFFCLYFSLFVTKWEAEVLIRHSTILWK